MNRKTFAGFGAATGTPPSYDSTVSYTYDLGSRLASAVDSLAGTITPKYDQLDRLISEQTPQGMVSYDYDPAGRRTSMTVAGQPFLSYSYDNANRLTQITQGGSTLSFAYDANNRRASLTLPNGVTMSYSYDNASQLTGISYANGNTSLGNLTYGYDLAGRRTSMGGSLAQTALPLPVNEAEYNANNQLTEWGTASLFYDPNGNITSDGINSYVWNSRNQLASMNLGADSFRYDAYGRRYSKTISSTTTNFLYDGANVVQELSGTTPTANLLTGGIDEVFTRTDSSGTANFLTDALGTTLALTNSSGSTIAQYAYEPFGNTFVTSGGSTNSYEYTGRENDGTGLYFYRGRYYNPALERFVSEDPLGYAGNSVNFYEYTYDRPTGFKDPMGLQGILIFLEDPIAVDPNLLDTARQVASPKQSLPMPDGGRIDLGPDSAPHFDKVTNQPINPPHVHEPLPPFDPPYDDIPRGNNPVPRPATNEDLNKAIQYNKPQPTVPPVGPAGPNPLPGRKSAPPAPDPCKNLRYCIPA